MNFIDSDNYDDIDEFLEKYGDIKSKERIDELHETIRPYILRRLKEDVEKSVPPKEETLIEVELTIAQKQVGFVTLCRIFLVLYLSSLLTFDWFYHVVLPSLVREKCPVSS